MSSTLDFLKKIKAPTASTVNIPIDAIQPDPDQPRTTHQAIDGMVPEDAKQSLERLADSIAAEGLDQPITVRETAPGRYLIAMGERRWRAFKLNRDRGVPNSNEIACFVRSDLVGSKLRLAQLTENLQREDLTDIEVAVFLKNMLEEFPDLQKQDLAKLINVSNQYISRILALLDPRWADVVNTGIITYASLLEHFRSLSEESREELVQTAKKESRPLTSGDLRRARVEEKAKKTDGGSKRQSKRDADDDAGRVEEGLAEEVQKLIDAHAPKNEQYVPTQQTGKLKPSAPEIRDYGGDAVIPAGTAGLNPALLEKRELKLTLDQLATLFQYDVPRNRALVASVMLPVEELKEAIVKLGGSLPDDDNLLSMTLAQRLNEV